MNRDRARKLRDRQQRTQLVKYDHPALHQPCDFIDYRTYNLEDLSDLTRKMEKVLLATKNGVGLAACQLGVTIRLIYVCPTDRPPIFMANPEIVEASSIMVEGEEGCLSYPGFYTKIMRPSWVRIVFEDIASWQKCECRAKDFTARICSHEIQHTQGICLVGDAWETRAI